MIYICLAGLLATAGFGLLSDSMAALGGGKPPLDAAADELVRQEMVAMGWQPPSSKSLRELSRSLHATHGVEILHVRSPFSLRLDTRTVAGSVPRASRVAAATVIVADELSLYPRSFLVDSSLRRISLCASLTENRQPIPSLPNYRNTLLLDADASPAYLRRLLHHEVFHFADVADDGEVLWDPTWEGLNRLGFEYGHGGRDVRQPTASALTEELPGFLTPYSTAALEEDKAEVFAFLMVEPTTVARRALHDPVLAAKVARIEHIARVVSPEMTDAFWARVARTRSAQH
jgi:hypothetical protein